MGISKSAISEALRNVNDRFNPTFLARFAETYKSILSSDWLLTGTGEMVLPDGDATRPDYPVAVAAGFTGTALHQVTEADLAHQPVIPFVPSYDFTIHVAGESMLPEMHPGDTLACRWMAEPEFKAGHYYVIDTREGAVVKMVERHGDTLRCSSLNPAFDAFDIDASTILRAAVVVGVIRKY